MVNYRINDLPDWAQWLLVVLIVLSIIFGIAYLTEEKVIQPKIKPCNHLTERQVVIRHEKYTRFLDELYNAKKQDVPRLVDSTLKYRIK